MASKLATDIGERMYEFDTTQAMFKAKEIFKKHKGDQKSFEIEMVKAGIGFYVEFDDLISQF